MGTLAAFVWNIGWALACFFIGRFVVRSSSHLGVKLIAVTGIAFFFMAAKITF